MAPKVCRKTSEDHFLEVTPKKKNGLQKLEDNIFGRVWENSGKNPLHPPKNVLAPTPKYVVNPTYAKQHKFLKVHQK